MGRGENKQKNPPKQTEKHLNEAKYVNGKDEQGSWQAASEALRDMQKRGVEIQSTNHAE